MRTTVYDSKDIIVDIPISTGNIKSRAGEEINIMPYIASEVVQEVKRMDLVEPGNRWAVGT